MSPKGREKNTDSPSAGPAKSQSSVATAASRSRQRAEAKARERKRVADLRSESRSVKSMIGRGRLRNADARLAKATQRFPELTGIYPKLARAYAKRRRWAEAGTAARRGCEHDRNDLDLRLRCARYLLAGGQLEQALQVVAEAPDSQRVAEPRLLRLVSKARVMFKARQDRSGVIKALEQAAAMRPDDEAILSRLFGALNAEGRWAETETYRNRLKAIRTARLPSSLAKGLDALWRLPEDKSVPDAALQWAWEHADKSAWNWEDWRAAVDWGRRANILLSDKWNAATGPSKEIRSLIEAPDTAEMRAAMGNARGCLLVGTHMGPIGAALHHFQFLGPPFRVLGPASGEQLDPREGPVVIPVRANRTATAREAVAEARSGSVVAVLSDLPGSQGVAVDLLGRRVMLPAFTPKLIRLSGAPSFWCAPFWRDGRIAIELERLPDPREGEPMEAWIDRWYRAYSSRLEQAMRGHPANLSVPEGAWKHATWQAGKGAPRRVDPPAAKADDPAETRARRRTSGQRRTERSSGEQSPPRLPET